MLYAKCLQNTKKKNFRQRKSSKREIGKIKPKATEKIENCKNSLLEASGKLLWLLKTISAHLRINIIATKITEKSNLLIFGMSKFHASHNDMNMILLSVSLIYLKTKYQFSKAMIPNPSCF